MRYTAINNSLSGIKHYGYNIINNPRLALRFIKKPKYLKSPLGFSTKTRQMMPASFVRRSNLDLLSSTGAASRLRSSKYNRIRISAQGRVATAQKQRVAALFGIRSLSKPIAKSILDGGKVDNQKHLLDKVLRRLDRLVYTAGFAVSLAESQRLIRNGHVEVGYPEFMKLPSLQTFECSRNYTRVLTPGACIRIERSYWRKTLRAVVLKRAAKHLKLGHVSHKATYLMTSLGSGVTILIRRVRDREFIVPRQTHFTLRTLVKD